MTFHITTQSTCCVPNTSCCDGYPVAIIGAGPIGLAAAAHLQQRNIPFFIVEKGDVADNIRSWQHVTLFSPWQYNIDHVANQLLTATGWQTPIQTNIPTGAQLIDAYLQPLAALFEKQIFTHHEVIGISKEQTDRMKSQNRAQQAFQLVVETKVGIKTMKARAIIDATGTWGHPSPAASNGLWLRGEQQAAPFMTYTIPTDEQLQLYASKHVAVIGSGHSAIQSLLQLVALKEHYPQTTITWIVRKARIEDAYGGGSNDELAARGELGLRIAYFVENGTIHVKTAFTIEQVRATSQRLTLKSQTETLAVDYAIVNTGSRPNFDFHRELRYEADAITEAVPALAPLIDPNEHSCGTVAAHGERELRQVEPNFYIVGAKSYGRAPTFLMATGYEQVRSVTAYLAGDIEAATQVELSLPETGVCHSGVGGCC
ncbi:NAD(P)-binding domain-containing protein [Caryophanon tenue]|uniref:Flavoprotein n=1 Tax=Caryophanon tenue TaxID=33978 RepID=A0A1C0YBW7_9BACL|nr:NAD(P)-binding domain-containing protein [Caryophanon tenue]OCS84641.1 flavoprotein [Caryophanon tenue]